MKQSKHNEELDKFLVEVISQDGWVDVQEVDVAGEVKTIKDYLLTNYRHVDEIRTVLKDKPRLNDDSARDDRIFYENRHNEVIRQALNIGDEK